MDLGAILTLECHGPDTYVGAGPKYPWGGLYGGQIVAQALVAAAETVDEGFEVHSLRAYFIRMGDHTEPVRLEVDRTRNGSTFCTRRVIARQATGAILNLEASFQRPEPAADLNDATFPAGIPNWTTIDQSSWSPTFQRAMVPGRGPGRATAWMRADLPADASQLMHRASLAFLSDDLPTDAVVRAHPIGGEPIETIESIVFTASLDHTIWFHRPIDVTEWHLHDVECLTFVSGRGLTLGRVHDAAGEHVATIAQEVLLRDRRGR